MVNISLLVQAGTSCFLSFLDRISCFGVN